MNITPLCWQNTYPVISINTFVLGWQMESLGSGHCDDGYYAGWDGQGVESVQDCKNLCIRDDRCKFAAYLNQGSMKTCSRYNKATCNLDTSSFHKKSHETFAKKGKFLWITAIYTGNKYITLVWSRRCKLHLVYQIYKVHTRCRELPKMIS